MHSCDCVDSAVEPWTKRQKGCVNVASLLFIATTNHKIYLQKTMVACEANRVIFCRTYIYTHLFGTHTPTKPSVQHYSVDFVNSNETIVFSQLESSKGKTRKKSTHSLFRFIHRFFPSFSRSCTNAYTQKPNL